MKGKSKKVLHFLSDNILWTIVLIGFFVGCCLLGSEIKTFSMIPRVMSSVEVSSEEMWVIENGDAFLMGVSLHHDSRIPVVFDSAMVKDTITEQALPVEMFLYDEYRDGNNMMGTHCGDIQEIKEHYGRENMSSVSGMTTNSQGMVLGILWTEFPPWDHPIDIQVSYKVLGLVSKTEHVIYHWDTEKQELEPPSQSLLDKAKEIWGWFWEL